MGEEDYIQLAEQERARQWNIAKQYMQTPSLPSVLGALGAIWNALPFNTTAATVNPYIQYGEAPNAGGTIKPLSTFKKLSKAAKIQNAKSQIVRKSNAATRRAAERQAAQEQWELFGNNAAYVRDPYNNYVYNEAERSAAVDFLKENPAPIQEQYLVKNYPQRQLQENLRYAAEKGQTKMRYPTSETAAKIEGYQKGFGSSEEVERLRKELHDAQLEFEEAIRLQDDPFIPSPEKQLVDDLENKLRMLRSEFDEALARAPKDYSPDNFKKICRFSETV